MDPFSVVTGTIGTFGVLVHSTKALIELVGDVRDAPAEVARTAETAKAFEQALLDIATQVQSGQIPGTVVGTSDVLLSNCSAAVEKLTIKLKPHIEAVATGRKWRSRMKWAIMDKKSILEMIDRLEQNKTALNLGLTTFSLNQSKQQAEGLNTKLTSMETLAKDHHTTASASATNIQNGVDGANNKLSLMETLAKDHHTVATTTAAEIQTGVENLDLRVVKMDDEARERDLHFAAEQKAFAAQQKAQTDAIAMLTQAMSQLTQKFTSESSNTAADIESAKTKTDLLRDLIARVKGDPLYALQAFFEGSTIIESENTKTDVANLETLEEDYMILEEPDDIAGQFVKSLEERIEDYGGMDDANGTLLNAVLAGDRDVTIALLDADADVNARNPQRRTPLMLASSDDQKLIARTLLDYNAEINAHDEGGLTALHLAAKQGFHAMCTLLIKSAADMEAKSLEGDTPLRAALTADRPHIVQLLIENNCNSKALGPGGESVLHLAVENASAKNGSIASLRALLDSGVNPNLKDSTAGRTALHLAAEKGNTDSIALLLNSKAIIDALDDNLDTALLVAARAEKAGAVKMLVAGGANIDFKNSEGMSALNETAKRLKAVDMIQALLDSGADVESRTLESLTPFLRAARWGNDDALKLLLKVSDIKATNNDGNTAMHYVACHGTAETARLLVAGGAELNASDSSSRMPLHQAASNSNVDVLEFLLDQGIDIESPGIRGGTALHYAAANANTATLSFLLKRKANIEAYADKDVAATALLRAVYNNKLENVHLLLKNGANVSANGFYKYFGLHICAWKGFPEMATLLLQNGAAVDMESLDQDGMTPLLRAAVSGKEAVAQLLIKHGANIQAKRPQGDNAFRIFCRAGIKTLSLFRQLAEQETDINAKDEGDCVPILHLAVGGQSQIVAAAVEKGADVHALNIHGLTPLSHAARFGFKDIVITLLNAGADINHKLKPGGATPILQAAANGHVEVLKVLIARGADLSVKNDSGKGALEVAFAANQKGAIALLSTLKIFVEPSFPDALKNGDVVNIEILLTNNPTLIDERDEKKRTPLHNVLWAGGKRAVVELLLRKGASLTAQDSNGMTPLMVAVGKNQTDSVAKILEKDSDMSLRASKDWTALHYAARWNNSRYISKILVEHGAQVDAVEAEIGSTPLHIAAAWGRLDTVSFLLESGADMNFKDKDNRTPLLRALHSNQSSVAEYLIEQGVDISIKSEPLKMSALCHAAAWTKSASVAKLLCHRGAVVDDLCSEKATPLARAALNANEQVFQLLLDNGANLENLDIYGQTLLQRACQVSNEKGVRMLLQAKAAVNFKDERNGMTALHYAAGSNTSIDICKLLLDNGAELNAKDNNGATPIYKAVFQNNMAVLKYLVQRGADLEVFDNDGFNALHRAVRGGHTQPITVLLELGADIHAKTTTRGLGMLHIAAIENSSSEIVHDLIRRGAAIEGRDIDGNTPLLRAAWHGGVRVMKVLLESGAEKEVRNIHIPSTPLLRAISKSQVAAAQCLIENGASLAAETTWGWRPIHEAVRFSVRPVIELLIDRGQLEIAVDKPSSLNMHGFRALHIAIRETMNVDIVKMLVERGADIEARNHLKLQTPFLNITEARLAVPAKTHTEMLDMAKLLASLGADVRATDKKGQNLLFGAARERAVELFEWLLEQGLSIDSEDVSKRTVLHIAAEDGKTETIEWLLTKGANTLHRTTLGKTPLHLAVSAMKLEAVKLLATMRGEELIAKDKNGKTPLDLARAGKHGPPKETNVELKEKAKKEMMVIYNYLFELEHPFS